MFEIMVSGRKVIDVDTMGKWRVESNKLPGAALYAQSINTGTRVYRLGGHTGIPSRKIYSAPIVDGLIGEWITESNVLPIGLYNSQAIKIGSRVYLLGGQDDYNMTRNIFSAPIVDGLIGEWITESNFLPSSLGASQVVRVGCRVYLLGGLPNNRGGKSQVVFSAPIDSSGLLGNWVIETNMLPASQYYAQVIKTDSRVYLLGGSNNGGRSVYSAPIVDGLIGAWVNEGNKLLTGLQNSHVVKTDTRVYLLGGNWSGDLDKIFSAPLLSDGTIGDWIIEPNVLPGKFSSADVIVTDLRLYLVGGTNSSRTNLVYSTPLK